MNNHKGMVELVCEYKDLKEKNNCLEIKRNANVKKTSV